MIMSIYKWLTFPERRELARWLDAKRRYFARQAAAREGFELGDIPTALERFEVVEIEAMGGTALGIEVDVCDHEAVEVMVARVVQEWDKSMCSSRMPGV